MRVIYLHQYFVTPAMSGGTRSYEFARRLVADGHDVHIVTAGINNQSGARPNLEIVDGISVHWISVPYSNEMSYLRRLISFCRFAFLATRKATRIGGDVVFATSTPLTIALPGVIASRVLKLPFVFEVRDLWPEVPIAMGVLRGRVSIWLARMLEKFAYKHASHIIALSPGMAEGVTRTGYPAARISVIPNASDIGLLSADEEARSEFLDSHKYLRGAPLVVYTGTLGRVNGLGYMVDIAAEHAKLGGRANFLIVGDGFEKVAIEAKARELRVLGQNFFMIPPVTKTELRPVLSAATLSTSFVIDLPALWNNSANKFFDAFASGTPIAVNHQGWQAELLRESGAGIVLPPADAVMAARLLDGFLSDEARVRDASVAAGNLATQRFSREKLAAEFIAVLRSAAGSKPIRLQLRPASQ